MYTRTITPQRAAQAKLDTLLCTYTVGSIQKLQRVQNTAARIVLQALRRSHVQPLLQQLHCLPDYKLAVLTNPCGVRRLANRILYPTLHSTSVVRFTQCFYLILLQLFDIFPLQLQLMMDVNGHFCYLL